MKKFIPLILLLFAASACEKESVLESPTPQEEKGDPSGMIINNQALQLNQRVHLKDEKLRVSDLVLPGRKSTKAVSGIDPTKNYVFTLRAEVDPPVFDGKLLQASHVRIQGNFAIVTYNRKGEEYLGGVEVFDISDIENPAIISQAIFPQKDISSADVDGQRLFLAGAKNPYTADFDLLTPAFMEVLTLAVEGQITGSDSLVDLSSYVGTDIRVSSGKIFTTSGSEGGLEIFDMDLTRLQGKEMSNARSVEYLNDKAYVLQGQPGRISVFSENFAVPVKEYEPGYANIPDSKSELAVNASYIFAALNEGGVMMMDKDGKVKTRIPRPATPEGALDEDYVSNSVSLNGELVLIGNGGAGLYAAAIIPEMEDSLVLLGTMDLGASANFVESRDSVIFVATGTGGLKIISIDIDNGVPPDIIPTKPCETLYDRIIELFPESKNNIDRHPDLFGEGQPRSVMLLNESDVFVTFVAEGAGWKNTFGYYYYNAANPPASVADLEHHILFPNVSGKGEGGGLEKGDMLRLPEGPFPANTVIGFYLVAQGWKNGHTVDGIYTHYTNFEFNQNGKPQHTLFIENECRDLVMTFEDIRLPEGDKDFNDIIFTIKDNPTDSLLNTSFLMTDIPLK